ncbi:hypothetical protein [Enterobacter asburiae]|uniref:hypothetical protein n=1 Tax=Enterobacter asburiae TaxID=61645 RepID=UPI0021C67777|nr:hypothetical protein [Enterobacter asburiae]MCU3444000.1 hypothetical protein [Enterobacter asburiae]
MSFDFYLYRAAEGLGSLLEWEEDHAEPLGSLSDLQAQIDSIFPSLQWSQNADGSLTASDPSAVREVCELSLCASQGELVQFVITYASPSALRKLMTSLNLNYCCSPESGELRDPFAVGDAWGST